MSKKRHTVPERDSEYTVVGIMNVCSRRGVGDSAV